MSDQMRLTKVQAALMRSTQIASTIIGTERRIPIKLFDLIVKHYFRADRVFGATRELIRQECIDLMPEDRYLILPHPDIRQLDLPGCDPEPLSDMELINLIEQAGCVLTRIVPVVVETSLPVLGSRRALRKGVLLANHHYAEQWYGDALSSTFSHGVIVFDHPETDHSLALRSQLAKEKKIQGLPTPENRQAMRWRVTPSGIVYYEKERVRPTITIELICDIARRLDLKPLSISAHPGR